jgi:hypothetical protein
MEEHVSLDRLPRPPPPPTDLPAAPVVKLVEEGVSPKKEDLEKRQEREQLEKWRSDLAEEDAQHHGKASRSSSSHQQWEPGSKRTASSSDGWGSHTWTTNSWWAAAHTENSGWMNKRRARAAAFQAGKCDKPVQPGPVKVKQDCMRCHSNHHALGCERCMCALCCHGHPRGPCKWHFKAAAQMEVATRKLAHK